MTRFHDMTRAQMERAERRAFARDFDRSRHNACAGCGSSGRCYCDRGSEPLTPTKAHFSDSEGGA